MNKYFKDKPYLVKNAPLAYQNHFTSFIQPTYPYVMWFVYSLDEMKKAIEESIDLLEDNGILYLCYPKLKNTLNLKGIHRDLILPFLNVSEETGYVRDTLMRFNKMAAFDKDYTLLGIKKDIKPSIRKQDKTDYTQYIDALKAHLSKPALTFYNTLTKGYQTNWARYVYSAKRKETKEKRLIEVNTLLEKNIKTK